MSISKKIISQSSIFMAGALFSAVIGFFFKGYIAKELGPKQLGLFDLGMSIVALFSIVLSWGLGNGLVKFVSQYITLQNYAQLHTYLRTTLIITLGMCGLSVVVFLSFPHLIADVFLKTPELSQFIVYFAFLLILNGLITLCDKTIRGLQEVKRSTFVGQFIRLPFKILVVLLFVYFGYGLVGYIWAEILAAVVALILLARLVFRLLPKDVPSLLNKSTTVITEEEKSFGKNMLLINVIGVLQNHGAKFILVIVFASTTKTLNLGIYAMTLTLTMFVSMILSSVNAIFTPIISQLYHEKKIKKLSFYFSECASYIFLISFPVSLFLYIYSEPVLAYFGEEYKQGIGLLRLLVVSELVGCLFGSVGMMLNMMGSERYMRNLNIFNSLLTFTLYMILIPKFGLIGLGVSILISKVVINLLASVALYSISRINVISKKYILAICFCLLSGIGILFWVEDIKELSLLSLFLQIGLFYSGVLSLWVLFFERKILFKIYSIVKRVLYHLKKIKRNMFGDIVLHVVGDSHTEVFSYMEYHYKYFWGITPKVKTIHGATATGLQNPNSKTNSKEIITKYKSNVKNNDWVLFQLGEVDCGFAIWYRASKHEISIDDQLKLALTNYCDIIDEYAEICESKIIIQSTMLPTIFDGEDFGEVANKRSEVDVSIVDRTKLTDQFNILLEKHCSLKGYYFMDLSVAFKNKSTGLIDRKYLNENPLDHHLSSRKIAPVIYLKLKAIATQKK